VTMDVRDEITWAVLELSPHGERVAEAGLLEEILRDYSDMPEGHPVFVPYLTLTYSGTQSLFSVMEGYAFVGSGLPDHSYRGLLNTPYVRGLLSRGGNGQSWVLDTVPDASVRELRQRLNELVAVEIQVDMKVTVIEGSYSGLEGKVVSVGPKHAMVLVELRSLRALKKMPRFILRPWEEPNE